MEKRLYLSAVVSDPSGNLRVHPWQPTAPTAFSPSTLLTLIYLSLLHWEGSTLLSGNTGQGDNNCH